MNKILNRILEYPELWNQFPKLVVDQIAQKKNPSSEEMEFLYIAQSNDTEKTVEKLIQELRKAGTR